MIAENIKRILGELPPGVELVVAVKRRTPEEVLEAIRAGARIIGESQVQQAERDRTVIGTGVQWHLIGHLQSNKVKKAVKLFDMIETVDSIDVARKIDTCSAQIGKVMPVLIEVNIAREPRKTGVVPQDVTALVSAVARLPRVRVMGLMTLGPRPDRPEAIRPHFREMKRLFEMLRTMDIAGVEMKYLSMGMSDSYRVAIEEGANIVRVGTLVFQGEHSIDTQKAEQV